MENCKYVATALNNIAAQEIPDLGPLLNSLDLNFRITGHTKFAPNWCFVLIKQRIRKTRMNTLSEIAGFVKDSIVTEVKIPQLVGLEDGTVLVESYGWQLHQTPYFRPLPQTKQYQCTSLRFQLRLQGLTC
uniref:Chaperonin n=1 Tax=Salmo salar TaxID=8030 RepID=A8WCK0_SALSA|nr:chaperonin [Salmo salar]